MKSFRMWRLVLLFYFICCGVYAHNKEICSENSNTKNSCTTQILGQQITDKSICQLEVLSQSQCDDLKFNHKNWNEKLGGVTLKPYILEGPTHNYTMLNITFSNIKWKTMKLRVYDTTAADREKHCRNINLSNNVLFDDQSILYYDCYWSEIKHYTEKEGQKHILEYEVSNDENTNTGLMYFNLPTNNYLLDPLVTEDSWRPFIYVEKFPSLMLLHINSPPENIKIDGYEVQVAIGCKTTDSVKTFNVLLKNNSEQEIFEYKGLSDVSYCFSVTPLHVIDGAIYKSPQTERSPEIPAVPIQASPTICIVSVATIIFTVPFACYFTMVAVRNHIKKMHKNSKQEVKLLIVNPSKSRFHDKIVRSLINCLNKEMPRKCKFELFDEDDIPKTEHEDPKAWADEAFSKATHILYCVGPQEGVEDLIDLETGVRPRIYKNLDKIIESFSNDTIANNRRPPQIAYVFFDYSDKKVHFHTQSHYRKIYIRNDISKIMEFFKVDKKICKYTSEYKQLMKDLDEVKKLMALKRSCDV